jgi:Domain of unknown function (DUF4124)
MHKITFLLLSSLSLAAQAADLYKWTDEKGQVHYGDAPAGQEKKVEKIQPLGVDLTDEQRQDAAARRTRETSAADSARQARENEARPVRARRSLTGQAGKAAQDSSCEAQKQRYRASQSCFAPYVTVDGAVKAEAYKHCTQIAEPQC